MRNRISIPMAALAATVCALLLTIERPAGAPGDRTLAVSGRDNANVSMAADGAFVVAVWSAALPNGGTDILASVSSDGGASFGDPVRVNSTGEVSLNGEQPPRVTLGARANQRPAVSVVWTAKGPNGTKLMSARSTDGGRTFSAAATIAGGDAAGNRGWEAIAYGPGGRVFAAWLDHRQLAKPQENAVSAQHHHGDAGSAAAATSSMDGVAMAQLSQLYVSAIDNPQSARAVTGGVCYCCKTALATSGDAIYLAWRHVYPGNMRDIAFSASRDGGRTFSAPVRISEDKWQLDGCPDDGPTMALDGAGRIHVIWPTVVQESGRPVKALFHAMSSDGRSFSARTRLPTNGQANHPQLAVAGDGRLVVVWDESGSGSRHLAVASGSIDSAGKAAFTRDEEWSSRQATYPFTIRAGEHVLFAWTETAGSASLVRVARYR